MANYRNQILGGAGLSIGSQTVNITGAQGSSNLSPWSGTAATISLSDLDWNEQSHVKQCQMFEIDVDLLALSVAWHRLRTGNTIHFGFSSLLSKELYESVTTEDKYRANQIRDYYSKKLMMLILRDIKLSPFREDLKEFIHGTGMQFSEKMQPLVYRLPEFYDYDVAVDKMFSRYNVVVKGYDESIKENKVLTHVDSFRVERKKFKYKEFWFRDHSNSLVALRYDANNPLLPFFEHCIRGDIILSGSYRKVCRDGREHLQVTRYEFLGNVTE